ncbi:hypothetical protein DFQ27_008982 [Actinomortierella ambigua]|uniref:START domain-containing protein n=1 Tax=Actinomortierella ambigua TaxID=1343610 RepID=A0A9P6TY85_9FUNG|nr:hypothetical protein DFQ27_008982 [Actinomortierella ambigua]
MDLNHDSATDRYTETLSQALTYFREIAQSNSGWKRLSTSSVRTPGLSASTTLNPNLSLGFKGSSSSSTSISSQQPASPTVSPSLGFAAVGDRHRKSNAGSSAGSPSLGRPSSTTASSPVSSRHDHDPIASLPGGAPPSSAALAAIDSLLPSISVSKKNVPGKSAEIVRASIVLPGIDALTDLEDWKAVLECTGARRIWDRMVESSTVMQTLDDNTCITRTIFKTAWLASPRDALLIETTLLDHNAVLHIATSIKPSDDDPIFLRPSPPHIRAYLPLVAWHIQLVPAEVDESQSFTSFNSLTASQNRQVMPRHSIRVSFYYQIDMRGWAANSAVSIQSHVPSCITNIYKLLRRQGVPPHVSRHSPTIQLDLNEYDPTTGVYELRYDVILSETDDGGVLGRTTISSKLKNFRLGTDGLEESPEFAFEKDEGPLELSPQEIVLSDDEDDDKDTSGYVDVELDGERWGLGSDIVVHIFMNDIEDEEFVQEHVECLKYMERDRYILRMHHNESGSQHGAINVKLRIERIPQHSTGGAKLMTPEQLKRRLLLQDDTRSEEHSEVLSHAGTAAPTTGLSVSVNGREKGIVQMKQRASFQSHRRLSMSAQEQLELSRHIVQEVISETDQWIHSSEGGGDGPIERTTSPSPLLLMSTSMPTTMQSLSKSNQSIMSSGTNNMTPGNTNPGKVNSSFLYFSSLLHEPATSWKQISQQRGVTISKLEAQGHIPGIVKGEGEFDLYSIWDIKAALECISARKVWDKLFDDAQLLAQVTPSSILSYVRLKGFWPTSPKDMAVLNTTFISKDAIHYFATSTDDINLFPMIPPPMSPFVRSEIAVSGWYIEAVPPRGVKIVFIAQAAQSGWAVPGTALSAMTTELPLCVAEILKYLENYGSPPTLVSIRRGRAIGMDYDHEKCSFRLEYVQDSSPVFSGQRQAQQKFQWTSASHLLRRNTIDFSSGGDANLAGGSSDGGSQPLESPKMNNTTLEKLLAEIRLDGRYWARNGDCDITIDPPPSKVTCSCVAHDGTGYRIRVEHSSGRAVPAGGKVLLMAKKPTKPGNGVVVNGVPIKVPEISHLNEWMPKSESLKGKGKDHALTFSAVDEVLSQKGDEEEIEDIDVDEEEEDAEEEEEEGAEGDEGEEEEQGDDTEENGDSQKNPSEADATKVNKTTAQISRGKQKATRTQQLDLDGNATLGKDTTPLEHAQQAMDLLKSLQSDPDDAWSIVSYKNGLTTAKRFVPDRISEQVPVVRGEKIIEGFSLDEVATIIETLGTRAKLDDLFDSGEMLQSFGLGCATFHHVLKSYFPLPLPARDLYFVTATAVVEAGTRSPQVLIVSTSIPFEPEASNSTTATPRPRAHLHLSAWILEAIDPYSSSHPIPSTKVAYMTALDLGGAVPQRISGMLQTGFPKAITQVESYLQLHAAPPVVRIPTQMVIQPSGLRTGASMLPLQDIVRLHQKRQQQHLSKDSGVEGSRDASNNSKAGGWDIPALIPWTAPSSHISTREFKMDKAFFHLVMLFDHFDLLPSRLDLALEKRAKLAKQKDGKSRGVGGLTASPSSTSSTVSGSRTGTSTSAVSPMKNKTVLELVVDLKQYPEGYDIQTEIKVDPEFLLQHKQQREAEMTQQQHINSSTGTTSALLPLSGDDAPATNSNGGGSTVRRSLDLEKSSSRAGIATLLSSTEVPRGLSSSAPLLKILPPPLTVQVLEVPPAPSHSSSLSVCSKRHKHLILVTVPEAEPSPSASTSHRHHPGPPISSHGGGMSSSSSSRLSRGSRGSISAGNILSGSSASSIIQSTGKPKSSALQSTTTTTVTTMPGGGAGIFNTPESDFSSDTGPPSSHMADGAAVQFTRSRVQTGPSTFSGTTTIVDGDSIDSARNTLTSLASTGPAATLTTMPLQQPEKRVFQFGIKLVRLDSKDSGGRIIVPPGVADDGDTKWTGHVTLNGSTVSILDGFTRQEIGFMDSVVTGDDGGPEDQDVEDRLNRSKQSAVLLDHADENGGDSPNSVTDHEDELIRSGNIGFIGTPRRRSHHRQQLAVQQRHFAADNGGGSLLKREHGAAATTVTSVTSTSKPSATSSMYGLSSLLSMLGGGSKASTTMASMTETTASGSHGEDHVAHDSPGVDKDETIRVSKSRSRSKLQMVQENDGHHQEERRRGGSSSSKKKHRGGHHMDDEHHVLDLESIHGSIIFPEQHQHQQRQHQQQLQHNLESTNGTHREWMATDDRHRDRVSDTGSRRSLETGEEELHGEDVGALSKSSGRDPQEYPVDEGDDEVGAHHAGLRRRKNHSGHSHRRHKESSSSRRSLDRSSRRSGRHYGDEVYQAGVVGDRNEDDANLAEHPRFTGSNLYAYSFRNLMWAAVCCLLLGVLLRVYVIGPSFFNTLSSSPSSKRRQTTYYYYYYPGPAMARGGHHKQQQQQEYQAHGQPLTSMTPWSSPLTGRSAQFLQHHDEEDGSGWIPRNAKYLRRGEEDEEENMQPQGIKELFSVRGIFGYNFVLLAFPDERPPRQPSPFGA